jgi:hypothetical protein
MAAAGVERGLITLGVREFLMRSMMRADIAV